MTHLEDVCVPSKDACNGTARYSVLRVFGVILAPKVIIINVTVISIQPFLLLSFILDL